MDRRRFVSAVAHGALAAPLIARAQTATRVRRIGWLGLGAPPPPAERQQQYAALRELGWIVGQNLLIDQRYGSAELLPRVAREFVRLRVDLIVADGTVATLAAKNATTTIPILMWSAGDPVGAGLVASLARPGGNITGYALLSPEIDVKRLSLLRELLPATQRVGELINSTNPYFREARKPLEEAYRSLGMQPIFIDLAQTTLEDAMTEMVRQRVQALHVPYDALFGDDAIVRSMRAALKHALPTIVDGDELLEAGGLLSYDYNLAELQHRDAAFIDRILRGAKPFDLPIEQPTKFDLMINLRTAKALGIAVPHSLLLRADKVIP
jgi:putative tryptophan/tyrosine transport system substrate-binding protein